MKIRYLALSAAAASIVACNAGNGNESVQISLDSGDDVKIAYMLGSQFAMQLSAASNQLDFTPDDSEFGAGILDGNKMILDTAQSGSALKFSDSVMSSIAREMQTRAVAIQASRMPPPPKKDSLDTAAQKLPEKPGAMSSEQVLRASYLLGVQFGAQFASLSKQSETDLNLAAFRVGLNDSRAAAGDSTKNLQLSQDSLQAINLRLRDKLLEVRKAAMERAKAQEDSLKKAIAPLRGDTLSDGTQAKMNFKVKATGVNVSVEDLEAYAGKPLFVFYFSTTCGHCRHATPEIKEIANSFKDRGIKSVAVASGGNNKRAIRSFIEEFKLDEASIDVLFDESREFGELYSDGYVPKVYVVKPDGSLMTFKNFESQKDSIVAELGKLAK